MSLAVRHGVVAGCEVAVSADGTISVSSGSIINNNVGAAVAAQSFTATSGDASFDRYDRLVADTAGNLSAVTGVNDGTLLQPDTNDVILANYIMRAAATAVAAADFNDVRHGIEVTYSPYHVSGTWYGASSLIRAVTSTISGASVNGSMYLTPFYTAKSFPISAIGTNIVTAASAGSVARFGIYTDDGSGQKTLLVDGGTASLAATGNVSVSVTATLTPGVSWRAIALQSFAGTAGIYMDNAGGFSPVGAASIVQAVTSAYGCVFHTGVTGALPTNPSSPAYNAVTFPVVVLQAA